MDKNTSIKNISDNITGHPDASEILNFLISNGSIDIGGVEDAMNQRRREKILREHPYAITRQKDGRWRTYVKDASKPSGRRLIARSTRESVEDGICESYGMTSEQMKREKATLADIFDEWIDYKEVHVADTTLARVKRDWKRYYQDAEIINKPIRDLTKLELDIWVHETIRRFSMNKHQYANFSLIIRQMLDFAVDLDIISKNLFRDVKVDTRVVLEREHKKPDESQVYTRHEFEMLQEHAWKDFNKSEHPVHQLTPLAVLFMFMTGVRVGEVCALKYSDIDGNKMSVRRTVRDAGNEVVEHTKGTFGDRIVPLVPQAMGLIEAARSRQSEEGASTEGYLFSMNDKPLLYSSVTKAFYRYCKELGIKPKSSHKARKTFVSMMIDQGMNINTVRQLVGHVDERTTLNNYCYDRSSEEDKINLMTEAFGWNRSQSVVKITKNDHSHTTGFRVLSNR